jgi:5-methyltetrahydrofolate--homocysteine methyltransferase
LREELQVNTTCGASNLSFGLPNRHGLNATFLPMAISSGMPCAITNPMDKEIMQAVRGANVIIGQDPECNAWIKHYREPSQGQSRRKRSRRRRSRS